MGEHVTPDRASAEPEQADPYVDPDRDNAIGGALLETEHIGGFARRAPYFVAELEKVGWTVASIPAEPEQTARTVRVVTETGMGYANGGNQPEPEQADEVAELGLSDEQAATLRKHLASRQQTVSEFFGDVLMDMDLGRVAGRDYPGATRLLPARDDTSGPLPGGNG